MGVEGIKISMSGFSLIPVERLWRWNVVSIRWFFGDYRNLSFFYVVM